MNLLGIHKIISAVLGSLVGYSLVEHNYLAFCGWTTAVIINIYADIQSIK